VMVSTARAAIGYATLLLHSAALLSLCTLVVGGGGAIVCTPSPTGGKPKCRICNCVRVRVYDPCSPPVSAVASWQAWGGCSEECARSDAKSIELTTHVMDVPVRRHFLTAQFALRCSCWLDSLHVARILAVPTETCPSCLTRGFRKVAACVNFFVLLLRLLCARSSKNPGCSACRYSNNMIAPQPPPAIHSTINIWLMKS
jgi:hypothetical protein